MEQNGTIDAPNAAVRNVQEMLTVLSRRDPSVPRVNVTGTFDANTRTAVEAFQAGAGLPVTGEVDAETFDAILTAYIEAEKEIQPSRPISPFARRLEGGRISAGDAFDLVCIVQCMLCCIAQQDDGLEPQEVTGVYDEATRRNVMRLQQSGGLEDTGEVDTETWNYLADLYTLMLDAD